LIERIVRNDEVVGLIPIWSTNSPAAAGGGKDESVGKPFLRGCQKSLP
jgi:hypothetical protein